MRQVPGKPSFLLIGDGRLAGHLYHYFKLKDLQVSRWNRRHGSTTELPRLLKTCDRVLLAISDDAVPEFIQTHRTRQDSIWIHFSGNLVVQGAWSAHPLCTFTRSLYSLSVYQSIPFLVEREGPTLEDLIPGLENPSSAIPGEKKPLYHALCVTAGNFTQLLWLQLFRAFPERLGLSREFGLPFLRQTFSNLDGSDTESVLTGPISRRDGATIGSNLAALRGARMDALADVYEAFLRLADVQPGEAAS